MRAWRRGRRRQEPKVATSFQFVSTNSVSSPDLIGRSSIPEIPVFTRGASGILDAPPSRGVTSQIPSLPAVDLAAHDGDGLLIDLRRIPGLDRREIRLARLITGAGAPAM